MMSSHIESYSKYFCSSCCTYLSNSMGHGLQLNENHKIVPKNVSCKLKATCEFFGKTGPYFE